MADSRPRVRGIFARNDEFGVLHKHGSSSHHYEEDEDGVRTRLHIYKFVFNWSVDLN